VESFKKNLVSAGDEYIWRNGVKQTCEAVDYKRAVDEAAKVFGWKDNGRDGASQARSMAAK
jgi:hypothetical protein